MRHVLGIHGRRPSVARSRSRRLRHVWAGRHSVAGLLRNLHARAGYLGAVYDRRGGEQFRMSRRDPKYHASRALAHLLWMGQGCGLQFGERVRPGFAYLS